MKQRLTRLGIVLDCDAAAAEVICRDHPLLLLLGPYALRRLASSSHESVFSGSGKGSAQATLALLQEVAVDAACKLQMRAMHWGASGRGQGGKGVTGHQFCALDHREQFVVKRGAVPFELISSNRANQLCYGCWHDSYKW